MNLCKEVADVADRLGAFSLNLLLTIQNHATHQFRLTLRFAP